MAGSVGAMARRTKIIATIGPASEDERTLKGLIQAGMDIARINLSHESVELALERYYRIRKVAADLALPVGILVDLPGPKVRVGHMPEEGLTLVDGQEYYLTPGHGLSSLDVIEVDYDELLTDVHEDDLLTFGDGAVQVQALGRQGDRIGIRVIHGGHLTGRPGIHIPSERLRLTTPTPEDLRLADAFVEVGVDMIALSFVRSAHDVRRIGVEPNPRGPLVVAKIETRAAVENLDAIVEASGAVMVARGDLGSEFPIEELPHLQKEIIRRCIAVGRPVITATQMLESMIHAPSPTRAEASDVANAVFDGSSTVMLSGETAIGADPVHVVDVMARIAERADDEFDYGGWPQWISTLHLEPSDDVEAAITNAMTSAAPARRERDRRRRHHLPVTQRVHRPVDRPLPTPGQDPRLLHQRPHRAPALDELGHDPVPPRGRRHVRGGPGPARPRDGGGRRRGPSR